MAARRSLNIGFIGLGAMGSGMVLNIAQKLPNGSKVYIYDLIDILMEEPCSKCPDVVFRTSSAKQAAESSSVIFPMVPEGSHVRAVYLDPKDGICATDISDKLLIDCSTIDTATCLTVTNYISSHCLSAAFYDAPVSGGAVGAANGNLSFFLGCAEEDPNMSRLRDLLGMMGSKIIPCGGSTLGIAAKPAHNYLGGIIFIASSEAMNMGIRSGLNAKVLASVFGAGAAQSTISDRFNPVPGVCPDAPSTNGYKPGFKVQLHYKDFGLAVDMAERVGATLALGPSGLRTYKEASTRYRDMDSLVVYRLLGGVEEWPGKKPSAN